MPKSLYLNLLLFISLYVSEETQLRVRNFGKIFSGNLPLAVIVLKNLPKI